MANDDAVSLRDDGGRLAGAIIGGLVAGLGITALLITGERESGKPSELAAIERAGLAKLGRDVAAQDSVPDVREQVVIQGGHLLLSATAGAAYALTTDDDVAVVPSGIGFGLAFYGVMHWLAGPLLGLKPPEWRSDKGTIAMHMINHVGFGIVTAIGARVVRTRA